MMDTMRAVNLALEIFGTLLSLIILLCLFMYENRKEKLNRLFIQVLLFSTLSLVSDSVALFFKGRMDPLSIFLVRAGNCLLFVSNYILLIAFGNYLIAYIAKKTYVPSILRKIIVSIGVTAIGLVILSQFNNMYYLIDDANMYQRQPLFWLSQVWGIVAMIIDAGIIFYYRKHLTNREILFFAAYIVFPVVAMIIQIQIYGLALLPVATVLAVLSMYVGLQLEQASLLAKKEQELHENQISIMLSQIQPHFLYNVLVVIRQLCDIDPKKAKEATVEFSNYLRGNLDALQNNTLISFEQELAHVQNYLSLEKKRFEDRISVKYEIEATDFAVPALSLQPIVENAVRYGITKKEIGGEILICTKEEEEAFYMIVQDNGVGFDPDMPKEDGRTHVGIQNVKERLSYMCNGTLEIESEIGLGTKAVICIPK
jgi:two-component system LytT family sensor kinase